VMSLMEGSLLDEPSTNVLPLSLWTDELAMIRATGEAIFLSPIENPMACRS